MLYYRYEEEKGQYPKAPELDRSCRALSSRWSDEEPQEGSEQKGMPRKGARMKIGDLICLSPFAYPDTLGVVTQILLLDEHGPLDVEVLTGDGIEVWEADEAEVVNESR